MWTEFGFKTKIIRLWNYQASKVVTQILEIYFFNISLFFFNQDHPPFFRHNTGHSLYLSVRYAIFDFLYRTLKHIYFLYFDIHDMQTASIVPKLFHSLICTITFEE